jgi:hypothetical protein
LSIRPLSAVRALVPGIHLPAAHRTGGSPAPGLRYALQMRAGDDDGDLQQAFLRGSGRTFRNRARRGSGPIWPAREQQGKGFRHGRDCRRWPTLAPHACRRPRFSLSFAGPDAGLCRGAGGRAAAQAVAAVAPDPPRHAPPPCGARNLCPACAAGRTPEGRRLHRGQGPPGPGGNGAGLRRAAGLDVAGRPGHPAPSAARLAGRRHGAATGAAGGICTHQRRDRPAPDALPDLCAGAALWLQSDDACACGWPTWPSRCCWVR